MKFPVQSFCLAAVLLGVSTILAAQTPATSNNTSSNNVSPSAPSASADLAQDLVIGPGDLLHITVFGADDFNQVVRVTSTGDISLPPLNSVRVAGLTTKKAEETIRKMLIEGGFYQDPGVSVFEQEYATQGVSVLGEVTKPGVYPLQGTRRLLDLIALAGGLTPKAGRTVSVTRRSDPQHLVTYNLPRDPAKSAPSNVEITPGDTIMVSTAGIVYVVGDVVRPAGFVMDSEKLTVLQVIALAGGANSTAALNDAKLIRQHAGQREEVPVPLKQILQAKAADSAVQNEDILFVPRSAGKAAAQRSLSAIVQMATGVVIYSNRY